MNSHQLQSVSEDGPCHDKKECPRSSDSTTSGTYRSEGSVALREALEVVEARLQRITSKSTVQFTPPTQKMLRKLVDWLIGICWNYAIDETGLFLAVGLMANFVKNRPVQRKQLQAVAVTALLLASKYTQVSKLLLKDAADYCGGAYSTEEIAELEAEILQYYDFDLELDTTDRYLNECLWQGGILTLKERDELSFWLEIELLMQNGSPRGSKEIFCQFLSFVKRGSETGQEVISEYMKQLIRFARQIPYTTLLRKHMSRFDTEAYIKSLPAA